MRQFIVKASDAGLELSLSSTKVAENIVNQPRSLFRDLDREKLDPLVILFEGEKRVLRVQTSLKIILINVSL